MKVVRQHPFSCTTAQMDIGVWLASHALSAEKGHHSSTAARDDVKMTVLLDIIPSRLKRPTTPIIIEDVAWYLDLIGVS